MGERSGAAGLVALGYLAAGLIMVAIDDVSVDWPAYLVAVLCGAVGIAVGLMSRGDPPARGATTVAVIASLIMVAVHTGAIDGRYGNANVFIVGTVTLIASLLCIRGRMLIGCSMMVGCVAVVALRAAALGYDVPTLLGQWLNVVPVFAMTTAFAMAVRPSAAAISSLRAQAAHEEAIRAGHAAALGERDRRLAGLDLQARELLELIASGAPASDTEVRRARLVQARLRDEIRAPRLTAADLAAEIWVARDRGIRVTLLDDHGASVDSTTDQSSDDAALEAMRREVTRRISAAPADSEITVRVLPRGRGSLATMIVRHGGAVDRCEFGLDGRVT